ncbi:LamG domain-containing protein [Alteromonas aestuariivivens]|uniref:LamG domain-containing protein n=1 Tax=Alteromonas aestuariivivens TaxID=1938339 RepID=A0A3D8MAV1_9ALTE|nr:LamG domain-containing protein [Alteromonas aestuariivivens]RDV27378.1 LamG domain-containing protein [Alteromonas aestuariivivens]
MSRSDQYPEVRDIADAVCSGIATEDQIARLEGHLKGNFEAQRFYYDYLNMHMQLQSPAELNMEFVYRRISEEVIVRPATPPPPDGINSTLVYERNREPDSRKSRKVMLFGLLVLVCLLASLLWLLADRSATPYVARVLQGNLALFGQQGDIDGSALMAGDYLAEQGASIQLVDGDTLHLAPGSVIKLFNRNEIKLKQGKLTVESIPGHNTIVHGRRFIVQSNGSGLTFDLTHRAPRITSGENSLLIPSRWRPSHFWSFNGQSDRVVDSAGSAYGLPASGAKRVDGLVGRGAFAFDNSASARIEVGSGGGTVPGTGSFAVTDGVTIEALIRPQYSGEPMEIDEIFRKDHGDDELRMLLSFQNDKGKDFLMPKGDVNESLSFGLFILGQGYHELKLPLDGQDGRPSLADLKDGNFHHVVATYSVQSGLKAIYIDGQKQASHQYPAGSKMLSGGPGTAAIGNNPAEPRWQKEAFSGIIDEVAFYDFALPEFALAQHLKNVLSGLNYYGLPANDKPLPDYPKFPLPSNTTFELDHLTGLPARIISKP